MDQKRTGGCKFLVVAAFGLTLMFSFSTYSAILPTSAGHTFAGLLILLLVVVSERSIGQTSDNAQERKPPVSPNAATAPRPASRVVSLQEKRLADLARRIAMAETESEADAFLQGQSDLVGVELGRALFLEILKLTNSTIPRETVLKVGLRLLRYTERLEMAPARGLAHRGLGAAYANLESWDLAERHLKNAISMFIKQREKGRQDLIWTYQDLAAVHRRKGDVRRALEHYENARVLASNVDDREGVIQAGQAISAVLLQLRDFPHAIAYLEQSLAVAESLADKGPKLAVLGELAAIFLHQGRIGKAIEAQESAYKTAVESNHAERLTYLFQTAELYAKLGDLPSAYSRFRRVLGESEKNGEQSLYFLSLLSIAQINEQYGREKKAAELYKRVIVIANNGLKDPKPAITRTYLTGRSEAVARLAEMEVGRGEIKNAVDLYKQNLEMLRSAQARSETDPRMQSNGLYAALESSVHTKLGDLYSQLGERSAAGSHFSSALDIAERIRYESGIIDALLSMATHAARNGEHLVAGAYLQRAEVLVHGNRRPDQLIKLKTTAGEVFVKLGRLAAADLKFQEALRLSESLRVDVTMPDQRASYFASLVRPFDKYIDFLMERHAKQPDAGFDRRAFDVSERRRARALLDSLRVARADIRRGVAPSLLEEEDRIRTQLNSAAREQFDGIEPLQADTDPDPIRKNAAPKTDIAFLVAELARVETAIRKQSPRYAELMQPRPLRSHTVQALLDDDTILLNYTLGEKQSYLWVISSKSVSSFVLPPREKVEDLVRRTYSNLSDGSVAEERNDLVISERETLARVLLGPAADLLGDRRIVVVADGALQYLPFSSLPDPRQTATAGGLMLMSNEIQFAPSASVVSVIRQELRDRTKAPRSVAIFADPVFSEDDERLDGRRDSRPAGVRSDEELITRDLLLPPTDGDSNVKPIIARLPFSGIEATAIFENAPSGTSVKAVDFEASRARLSSIDLSSYQIVHFATHGILDSEQPELSGIVLSLVNEKGEPVNGFLRLNEIYNMKLNADLVVLSACQTALGKEVRGEGLIGLTRGFMYAGSPRVVASLWKVDDVATAKLMEIFYAKLLKENMRPAAALRAAKMEMLKQKRWRSPYYWAGFELQGEWR